MRYKKILLGLLLIGSAIATARFCHHATQGFRIAKIAANLVEAPPVADKGPGDLLAQKYHYLGRGVQSFVFASEDGRYVLKVFNNRYLEKISLFSTLAHLPFLQQWATERTSYYEGKLQQTFASYRLAMDEMPEQTGLVYNHLQPTTGLPDKLVLVDRLNIEHAIDPNKTGFLIQKRAVLFYPALKEMLERQDAAAAKEAISSLVSLFFWKWRNGIADNDPLIRTNYAVLDGKTIQIDVGPLSKGGKLPPKQEVERIAASLKFWLNTHGPELVPFLEESLDREYRASVSSMQ